MKRVSVVVPTASRPDTLANTLLSISRQTARCHIEEVIVSENLLDRRSEEVCRRFPELPIDYRFQSDPMTPAEHLEYLFCAARGELVAILCDDDWWSPGHLQNAIADLDAHPEASAYLSSFATVTSELSNEGRFPWPALHWLAAGRPEPMSLYVLDQRAVLALSWIFTPFSFNTLVARRDAIRRAAPSVKFSEYEGDTMLYPSLVESGPLIYEPAADTYYRVHPGNYAAGKSREHLRRQHLECRQEILHRGDELGLDIPGIWRELLAGISGDVRRQATEVIRRQIDRPVLVQRGLDEMLLPPTPLWRVLAGKLKRRLLHV